MTLSQRIRLLCFKAVTRCQQRLSQLFETTANWLLARHLYSLYGGRVSCTSFRLLQAEHGQRWQRKAAQEHRLTIVVATYKQPIALDCLLSSLRCQTLQNFDVIVLHDGADEETGRLAATYATLEGGRYRYVETASRFNDFGHSLRDIGIDEATGEFLLITNGDNYYAPRFVEFVFDAIDTHALDLAMWNFVHSHSNPGGTQLLAYSPFPVYPVKNRIDIGSFMVRSAVAKEVGFRDKSHDGDASYLQDILDRPGASLRMGKVEKTLMVHN